MGCCVRNHADSVATSLVFSLLAILLGSPALEAQTVPVTVTITRIRANVTEADEGLEALGEDTADLYAIVIINGFGRNFVDFHIDDAPDVAPYWVHSVNVPTAPGTAQVVIQIKEHDSTSPDDDDADATAGPGNLVVLQVDLSTGRWTGDTTTTCSQGPGDEGVLVCFDISTLSTSGDLDRDGLLDGWELFGLDVDGGSIDVNLPAFGADPIHKDLFLEFDWVVGQEPTRAAIQTLKAAFAAAPGNAGGSPNPDGRGGINLWVDTGGLTDPTAREDGAGPNTCNDGIDNGGDGLADANDPDCLVGDNLDGGGNGIAPSPDCIANSFYALKKLNFNAARGSIFRYGVSGSKFLFSAGEDGAGPNTCGDGIDNGGDGAADNADPDCIAPCGGGRAEIGGNDFIEFNHDAGTIMHEFGHTLNLQHGGNDGLNCKPNHVSVMNYDNQFGIIQAGGNVIIDYSPPRFAGGRGQVPGVTLVENNLNDATVIEPSDATNRCVFTNSNGVKTQRQLNQQADWDSNPATNLIGATVNIDNSGLIVTRSEDGAGNNTCGDGLDNGSDGNADAADPDCIGPSGCANNVTNSTLTPFDDWTNIGLNLRAFGDSADGAINPVSEPELTLAELDELEQAVNTTDLRVTLSDDRDPAVAGENLVYTVAIENLGPNPASEPRVTVHLPAGVTFVSDTTAMIGGACVEAPAGTLTCDLPEILAGATATFAVTGFIARDLVYLAGAPTTITSKADVANRRGPDLVSANNAAGEDTLVVAVADLAIVSFEVVEPPSELIIGKDLQVTVRKVITNLGPSAPMDVKVSRKATATPGSTISPTASEQIETALQIDEERIVDEVFTMRCQEASHHPVLFRNEISPNRPDDTDPDLSNNVDETTLDIECVVPVVINIHPGGFPNSVNVNLGVIPVAVLTTRAGEYGLPLAFDARLIDPRSVRFGPRAIVLPNAGGAPEFHGIGHPEDSRELNERTRDGDTDMVLHFQSIATGIVEGQTEACVKGEWIDGAGNRHKFFGCDSIRVVPQIRLQSGAALGGR